MKQLARVFLRFEGLLFLGSAVYEAMNIARDYRMFVTDVISPENVGYGSQIFWMGVLRTVVCALTAFILLLRTDRVIAFLAGKPEDHDD